MGQGAKALKPWPQQANTTSPTHWACNKRAQPQAQNCSMSISWSPLPAITNTCDRSHIWMLPDCLHPSHPHQNSTSCSCYTLLMSSSTSLTSLTTNLLVTFLMPNTIWTAHISFWSHHRPQCLSPVHAHLSHTFIIMLSPYVSPVHPQNIVHITHCCPFMHAARFKHVQTLIAHSYPHKRQNKQHIQ